MKHEEADVISRKKTEGRSQPRSQNQKNFEEF